MCYFTSDIARGMSARGVAEQRILCALKRAFDFFTQTHTRTYTYTNRAIMQTHRHNLKFCPPREGHKSLTSIGEVTVGSQGCTRELGGKK